ncbi:MAG: site-2 protease family protein [Clostridia bacterium]|nr:site-2 protease family protein [Clostridia bacterium]
MLSNLLSGADITSILIQILLSLPIVLLSLSMHEMAHGYAADKLGDPTARNLGRVTLNPLKHLDPIGFICMLLFGFGWANPVPINSRYFKKPRRDMAIAAAAGPLSNLFLALIFTVLLKGYDMLITSVTIQNVLLANIVFTFLYLGIRLNITLAVFNLFPIPPLDGSRILYVFLPPKYYFGLMKYERYISLGIMLLLLLGVLDPVISFVSGGIMNLLFLIVGL